MQDALERAARALSCKREEIGERLEKLIASREDAEKRLRALMRKGADSLAKELAAKRVETKFGVPLVAAVAEIESQQLMRDLAVKVSAEIGGGAVVLGAKFGEKASIVALCGKDAVGAGMKAGDIVRQIAAQIGGKGGGKPDFAQGGGSPENLEKALADFAASAANSQRAQTPATGIQMYLKQVKINGFKSFADETTISLTDGITCIVGPNGCGKSNIVDSIRWVLGEQSAKALRGGKMQDVIFQGTESRKPLQFCEVSLLFSDCEKQLGTNFNEVEITRRVSRDGASGYFINGKAGRLKDIQNLFMDTGIGRVSYSFMVQGQIDQILSSNPGERRAIFEEAAGITKYKTQRREALNKLALVEPKPRARDRPHRGDFAADRHA